MPRISAALLVAALALAADASADVPPPKKGGCAIDGADAPASALALVALALVARRRPRASSPAP